MIEVTAAMICTDDRFLICQRPPEKNCGGKWEFPGGKIEPGETGPMAITRECFEELGITVNADPLPLAVAEHDYGRFSIRLALYKCMILNGSITLKEHTDGRMIRESDIPQYDFCPADRKLISQIFPDIRMKEPV